MSSAVQYGMRKVVACCECCIAYDKAGKFSKALDVIPSSSTQRIMSCMRQRIYNREDWSPEDFLSKT